jgi:hypothetical protein
MDARALGLADFRRSFTVDTAFGWRARRQAHFLRRQVMTTVERVSPAMAAGIRNLRAAAR